MAYLDQYRRGLIQGRLDALTAQGRIAAAALGELAVAPAPEGPRLADARPLAQLIMALLEPPGTRARVFSRDGGLAADSAQWPGAAPVAVRRLPPPRETGPLAAAARVLDALRPGPGRDDLPPLVETDHARVEYYSEAVAALRGEARAQARRGADGTLVLAAGIPVRPFKEVVGALLITVRAPEIEARVRETRRDVLIAALAALGVTALLSFYLARAIAQPIRQLASAAERVGAGRGEPEQIPDLSRRRDEIGDLSAALRRMTVELRARAEEIARFAADVAHELKNPLSSLRVAAETFIAVKDPAARRRLGAILLHDVERMTRLIADISAASRLDAELARAEAGDVDLAALLQSLADMERDRRGGGPAVVFDPARPGPAVVHGIADRLGQAFRNLIDNAVSFSPPDGVVRLRLDARADGVVATVEDDGPGLPPGKMSAIFERFYTDRPSGEAFGLHSGLGLAIVRRIVEAHGGDVRAENRPGPAPDAPAGARFIVRLPY